jgi:hypothetical protein
MRALEILEGVGDASLGEWHEEGKRAYHIRRRLTPVEQLSVGEARDLRGTREGQERLSRAWKWIPINMRNEARQEVEQR